MKWLFQSLSFKQKGTALRAFLSKTSLNVGGLQNKDNNETNSETMKSQATGSQV